MQQFMRDQLALRRAKKSQLQENNLAAPISFSSMQQTLEQQYQEEYKQQLSSETDSDTEYDLFLQAEVSVARSPSLC